MRFPVILRTTLLPVGYRSLGESAQNDDGLYDEKALPELTSDIARSGPCRRTVSRAMRPLSIASGSISRCGAENGART